MRQEVKTIRGCIVCALEDPREKRKKERNQPLYPRHTRLTGKALLPTPSHATPSTRSLPPPNDVSLARPSHNTPRVHTILCSAFKRRYIGFPTALSRITTPVLPFLNTEAEDGKVV